MDEIAEINPNVFLIFTGGDPLQGRDIWDRRFFRRWFFAFCDEILRVPHAASA